MREVGGALRVTLDLTAAVQGHAGLGRYADELARALQGSCPPDEELRLFYNDPLRRSLSPPLSALPVRCLGLSSKPWRLAVLAAQVVRRPQDEVVGNPNVFLATQHLLPRLRKAVSIFTLHDLIFRRYPAAHLPLNRWYLTLAVPLFLRAADAIIAVSDCSKRDAISMYGVPESKVHIIPEAADPRFRPITGQAQLSAVRERYHLPARFFLYVGTIEPRKNLVTLFDAFKELHSRAAPAPGTNADVGGDGGPRLVVVGKKGWLYQETFARLDQLGLGDAVRFAGFVAEQDLPAVYSLAESVLLPSLYEGFGLPVLEAMACGTPVVCSNSSSLPEVAGDAAILVDPTDVRGWAEAIERLAADPELRAQLRAGGIRRAAGFTWAAAAAQTRALYREIWRRHARRS